MSVEEGVVRVWRLKGKDFEKSCIWRSVKFETSVMIWGFMSNSRKGRLCILKQRVNSAVYQDILEHYMMRTHTFSENLCKDAIFQQDSTSCHSMKSACKWLSTRIISVLNLPSNSGQVGSRIFVIIYRKKLRT